MDQLDLLVVIPSFNEIESVADNYFAVLNLLETADFESTVLVINDGSNDGSADVLKQRMIKHIDLPINLGIAQVFILAVQLATKAKAKSLLIFDADGQHIPEEILRLKKIAASYPYVIGVRDFHKYRISKKRFLAISILQHILRWKVDFKFLDPSSGFRIYNQICFPLILERDSIIEYLDDSVATSYFLAKQGIFPGQLKVDMNQRKTGVPSTLGFKLVLRYVSIATRILIAK